MLAKELMVDEIPVVKTSDTGNQTLAMMDTNRVAHLPIVNNQQFLGLISEKDIFDNNCEDQALGNHNLSLVKPHVYENQHVFEVIDIMAKLNLTLIPVLDNNKNYLGSITLSRLIHAFAKMISIDKAGGIIILDMCIHDYSSSEIAQIIESNNAKILSLFVSQFENSTQINVTVKIDVTDINAILRTFERYDYTIKASFLYEDIIKSLNESRFESLIKYINM